MGFPHKKRKTLIPNGKWQMANEKAHWIILRSVNNELQQQHMGITTTYKILFSL